MRAHTQNSVFDAEALDDFSAAYPEQPRALRHGLHQHHLLTLDALAELSGKLAPSAIEYNRGDLPVGINPDDVPANGLAIAETIRTIDDNGSWMVLKNIENVPAYRMLLMDLLGELEPTVRATTGEMLTPQGYIFISSPGAVTPFHFDPEHNILLHLRGTKTMTVYPAGDPRFAADTAHETYHAGGHRNLAWEDDFASSGLAVTLTPGDAIYVPVMAPHWVKVADKAAISLSITWRSDWSYRESEARRTNALIRQWGMSPAAPPRWPDQARAKSFVWRGLRRLKLVK